MIMTTAAALLRPVEARWQVEVLQVEVLQVEVLQVEVLQVEARQVEALVDPPARLRALPVPRLASAARISVTRTGLPASATEQAGYFGQNVDSELNSSNVTQAPPGRLSSGSRRCRQHLELQRPDGNRRQRYERSDSDEKEGSGGGQSGAHLRAA